MPRRRGTGRSAARGGNSGKTRTTARQETSSATSRSRSSSSSTTSSRPTSTRPIEKANNPTEEQAKEANNPVIVADPVEQRWEEDAGMYTHKKFKKMASSVVVTSVATPPAEQPPLSSSVSSHFSIQQSLPLKHSALSLIETQQQQLRTVHHYQQQPVSHHPSQRVHVPPPSPSRLVIDEHGSEQPHRKNVCPYCNNSFAKPSVLEKHIRTHTNERPYPCNPCQIAFKTQSNLYKHSRSKSHELKVHQGIDSSYAEKVAELGDSFKEELDKPNSVPPPPSPMAPPMDQPRTIMINEQQQPRDFRMKATTVAIIPQQNQNHRIVNSRIPPVAHLEPPRPVADSIPQHIDKIISHNQTIVETLDPLWTKKFMRQQLKEDQQQQPSVVTLEKASPPRKFVTTNSGQVTMSLVNSKPTHQATVNLVQPGSVQVHHQSTSASSSPLSIHLARSQPPPPSHHAHPTLTVVPSGLRLNEQTPFMVVKQTEEAKKAEEMLNAKSVKEVWLNSHNRPSPVVQQPQHLNHHLHHHPNSLEGSMIKELLIKTRGATTLEPAGPIEQNRRDSASSNGSGGSQIVLQVTKAPFEPQMKLLPNVSLILTPTTSTLTASNLTVTSLPMSKSRILPQGLISQAPGISTSTPIYASEVLKCNMCQKSFSGIDLELHQREYCPARIVPSQQQNHIHHHQQQQQPSVIAQLREARLPEKHFRPSQELPHEDESPSKKPRLTILPHNQHIPVKTLLNSGGGIVTVSKAPIQPVHHGGLLQIAKPILQSGGRVQVTNKSIPGIPVPSMAGLLTGIKNVPSQALFSLPGKRTEIVPGMPGPSKEHVSTIPSSNQNEAVKMDVVKIESDSSKAEGGFLRPNSLPLTPGSFKPKKHVMIIGGDTLVSPETPRPRKSYMLQYQNGTAYTTLGFKSSTKVYYTTIFHQQPMYVANKPRISMYSNWRVVSKDSHPSNLTPGQSLNAYNSSLHLSSHGLFTSSGYTRKDINDSMIVSHSSKWKALKDVKPSKPEDQKEKDGSNLPANSSASPSSNSNVVRTVEGGYKSLDDDYTYVRGRGRGRYVCNSCGIRCKKPSMLKKHIRTHSNFRPYTCKYCNFAFKTKGNLTKHMKSKTHHKKCVELGISPVPTSVPDDYNSATDEPGVPGPSNSQLQPGDSDSEDLDSDGEEDNEQFEDAEDEVEIIGEDNSMVAKGLLPFKPKLSLYPYNAAKKEVTEATSTDTASTSVTTTATDSFQAPVIGEKYYFSKTPIPNEIAKQAAATVMALASSALKSVTTTSNTVTTITIPGLAPSNTMTTMSLPSIAQTNTMTTLTPGLIPSNTMTTFSLPSVAQSNTMTTLSPMILPSLAPTNTVTTITLPSVRPSLTTASSTNITSSAVTVLQPIVTSTAEESVTVMKVVPHELPEPTHRIGSLTIEKAPRNVNVLELSTSVAQQQPQQQSQPIVRKPVQLPHDVQLLAVQQNQEQPKRSPNKSLANTRAGSATAESYAESLVISPPNKNASEANKADVEAKSEQAANASNQNSNSNQASGSGKFVCEICQKAFPHHQQLFLHKKVHIFERPYRCDPCGISFRTFGTLQKHKRSTSHFNKVNINATFGEPSSSNPRPFLCSDCNTGFRIHGHLAKHLRSKSHIMKLENLGKLPIGLFAEMERIGTNFNEIDTQDCDSSLDSLKKMAAKLWKNKEISVDASNTNGLLSPHHTPEISIKEEPMDTTSTSSGRRSLEPEIQNYRKSPEFQQSATIIQRSSIPSTMNPPNGNTALNLSMPTNLVLHENKNHHDIRRASFSSSGHEDGGPPSTDNSDMENGLKHDSRYHKKFFTSVEHHHEPSPQVVAQTQPPPQPSPVTQPPPPAPPQQQQRILVPQVPQPTPLYGRPLHLSRGYPVVYSNGLISNMSREGSLSSDSGDGSGPISPVVNMKCEICGLSFGNSKSLQQHVLSHAQARPFVCHRCDAGFMAQHQLDAHMKLH